MSSQHRNPNRNYRPDDQREYEPVRKAVEAAGHDMNRFVRACLRWAAHDPPAAFVTLDPYLSEVAAETPRGRPRKPVPVIYAAREGRRTYGDWEALTVGQYTEETIAVPPDAQSPLAGRKFTVRLGNPAGHARTEYTLHVAGKPVGVLPEVWEGLSES